MSQRNLVKEGHHVLIFSQTRKMLNLIQVYVVAILILLCFTALLHLYMTLSCVFKFTFLLIWLSTFLVTLESQSTWNVTSHPLWESLEL